MDKKNKRRSYRRDIEIPIITRIIGEDDSHNTTTELKASHMVTTDISTVGVGLFSDKYLPVDSRVYMEIKGNNLGLRGSIEIEGRVRYCMQVKNIIFKCGIEFIDLPEALEKRIKKYIAADDNSYR